MRQGADGVRVDGVLLIKRGLIKLGADEYESKNRSGSIPVKAGEF